MAMMRLDSAMVRTPTVALDANGNTLTDASGKSYTWDFENRLVQAIVPGTGGGTTTFKYDPFGRRIQKSGPLGTTNYLYDGWDLIEEVDNRRVARPFDLAGITNTGGAPSFAPAGTVNNTYGYDSFGKQVANTGAIANSLQYTGRELDSETGLYYYRARYYNPADGRFLSEDPARSDLNLFSYVSNSPVNFIDPTGQSKKIPTDCDELEEYIKNLNRIFQGKIGEYDPVEDGSGLIPRRPSYGGGFHRPGVLASPKIDYSNAGTHSRSDRVA